MDHNLTRGAHKWMRSNLQPMHFQLMKRGTKRKNYYKSIEKTKKLLYLQYFGNLFSC